jgi:carbonic anhydrase
MVHASESGSLAVIAVLFKEGRANPTLDALWPRLPEEHGETRSYSERVLSPASLLPDNLRFFTLKGSLTTPPCSEEVRWLILKTPLELSSAQLERFRQFFPMNARPLQALNGREILESE